MEKVTKYELTSTERTTFRAVADAIWNICKLYDDDCEKNEDATPFLTINFTDTDEDKNKCPFSCFCPYFYSNGEKEGLSDVVRSIPAILEDIKLNENKN